MTFRPERMRFGVFLAPFHPTGQSATLALERDLELLEHLDRLDFDEAWIGEHHSAGWEIIADPVSFIAAAAQRTRHIRLGTGVVSLPYHHPFMVADRMVMLDHLTRGRTMLGVGPGALTSDAYMLGIEPLTQRSRMNEALEAILGLLRAEAPVTMETDWFTLRDARLQLPSFTRPHLPLAVAHAFSPAGPQAAGRHGIGMLSVASFQPGGLVSLQEAWGWAERAAEESGTELSRGDWRVVMPFHLADSREEAIAQARDGCYSQNHDYFTTTLGTPAEGDSETIEAMIRRGGAIVGTPDDAIESVQSLIDLSGGFGGFLGLAHNWAPWEQTRRSYELWARYVAPHFRGEAASPRASREWVAERSAYDLRDRAEIVTKAFADGGIAAPEQPEQMQRGRT